MLRTHFTRPALLAFALLATLGVAVAPAQYAGAPPAAPVRDASPLKPPPGARVAIVEFADLECPACAHANPTLKDAAAKYKIPWIRHDFTIPNHLWSMNAAVNARWFDQKSKALGEEYRDQVFANQRSIYNPDVLRQFTDDFAKSHGIQMPTSVDPQGKLAAAINADKSLGMQLGINQTPTIYIVMAKTKGPTYLQVQNPDKDLYTTIDEALSETKPGK